MDNQKYQNREEAKRQVEKATSKMPCGICGNKSHAGMMFAPADPAGGLPLNFFGSFLEHEKLTGEKRPSFR
jgi:hypothetical protein